MTKRLYQVVRDAVNKATGTLSCNWCFKSKPTGEVKPRRRGNGRMGHICIACEKKIAERKKA